MLQADISVTCKPDPANPDIVRFEEFSVLVGRVTPPAPMGDYRVVEQCHLYGTHAETLLRGYPRWAEAESLLIARAMGALIADALPELEKLVPGVTPECVATIAVRIRLAGGLRRERLLREWVLSVPERLLETWDADVRHESRHVELRACRHWRELLLQGQCLASGSGNELPPWPRPPEVPVHVSDGLRYVRLSELPAHLRREFERRMFGSTCPYIESETNPMECVYESDWLDFLAGRR